jgi:hypothetical protein
MESGKNSAKVLSIKPSSSTEDKRGYMTSKKLSKTTRPTIRISKSLEKYKDMVLFPEKVEKANQVLREVRLAKRETLN